MGSQPRRGTRFLGRRKCGAFADSSRDAVRSRRDSATCADMPPHTPLGRDDKCNARWSELHVTRVARCLRIFCRKWGPRSGFALLLYQSGGVAGRTVGAPSRPFMTVPSVASGLMPRGFRFVELPGIVGGREGHRLGRDRPLAQRARGPEQQVPGPIAPRPS